MSYARPATYESGQNLRDCDVCGMRFLFPREFTRTSDQLWRCRAYCAPANEVDDVVVARDRHLAAIQATLREMPPPPGSRENPPIPTYPEEADILEFVCRAAPDQASLASPFNLMALGRLPSSSGSTAIYLADLVSEARRPAPLLIRATLKLRELADYLYGIQTGLGLSPSSTKETDPVYGSFQRVVSGTNLRLATETATCGLGMLKAYQVIPDPRYLNSAIAAAHAIRVFQSAAFKTTGFTSSNAGGTIPLYLGAFCQTMTLAGTWGYDHRYRTDGWWPIALLSQLQAITGDITLGPTGGVSGFFSEDVSAPISECIADARAFWETGRPNVGTSVAIRGLDATTPRDAFAAYPSGTSQWEYSDGNFINGTQIEPAAWARSMWAMHLTDGVTARLTELWNYLRGVADDGTFGTPADTSPWTVADTKTGDYVAALAAPTSIVVRSLLPETPAYRIGAAEYDWTTVGMLAGLHADKDLASFVTVKKFLGVLKNREGASPNQSIDTRWDDLRRLGVSGLSFQTAWIAVIPEYFTETAAVIGNIYRYGLRGKGAAQVVSNFVPTPAEPVAVPSPTVELEEEMPSPVFSVNTIAQLSAYPVSPFLSGQALAYVRPEEGTGNTYILDAHTGVASDGINLIDASDGRQFRKL